MLNTTDYELERVRLEIDTVENVTIFSSGKIENRESRTWIGHYNLKANESKTKIFSLTHEFSSIPPKGYNPLKATVIVSDNPEDKDTIFFYVDDYNRITWIKGEVRHEKDFLEIYVDRLKKGLGMYP